MAWIQIDTGIKEHDKIFNLADRLNIPDAHAVGLMVCLWTWAVVAAPDGDITNFPTRAIAQAAGWTKKPEAFYEAICDPGSLFVETVEGRQRLRNWEDRAALLMDFVENQREKTRKRVQRHRERKAKSGNDTPPLQTNKNTVTQGETVTSCNATSNVTSSGNVTPENVTVTPVTGVPNLTLPNITKDKDTPPIPPASGGREGDAPQPRIIEQRFNEFWEVYPKKKAKQAALKAWNKIKPNAELHAKILAAIAQAKQSWEWRKENGQFIPYPASWINGGCWDDEPITTGGDRNADNRGDIQPAGFDPGGFEGFHSALDRYDENGDERPRPE